jgi:hypothetical protein
VSTFSTVTTRVKDDSTKPDISTVRFRGWRGSLLMTSTSAASSSSVASGAADGRASTLIDRYAHGVDAADWAVSAILGDLSPDGRPPRLT